ncbi:MAG: flagellar filament capping protein FliD [Proteobacteria bacterium]|nr:flagellar filament capping protein FliD [Pseudomonadota bacterium]
MAISSPGVGSRLDVNSIVTQLMGIENRPLAQLNTREISFQAKLSAFGSIRSALSQFQGAMSSLSFASRFEGATATSSDTAAVSASATARAPAGSYAVEVSALAQNQRLVAAGQATTTATIGTGTLTFDFGTISGGSFDAQTGQYSGAAFASAGSGVRTVTIASGSGSLGGIRDAINAAGIGVTASIVNDGGASPFRLVLSSDRTGAANAMKITVDGDAALDSLLGQDPGSTQNLVQTAAARNAELTINGVAVTKPTNMVSDALEGVTLTLSKTNVGSPATVSVTRDSGKAVAAAETFVKAYNDLDKTLEDLSAYNASTRTGAVLNGDPAVRSLQNQLRAVFSQPLGGTGSDLRSLSDIGMAFQRDGSLLLDATKMNRVMAANPGRIAGLFAPLGRSTDSLVEFVSARSGVSAGSYALDVTQLATRGTGNGTVPAGLTISAGVNDTLDLTVDSTAFSVTLAAGTYASASALAAQLQGRINGASALAAAGGGVEVSESAGQLTVTSNTYGTASKVILSGGNGMAGLFGASPVRADGIDAAGMIDGVAATGSGQTLTSDAGLSVRVLGGVLGARATIDYTVGYASQLSGLASAQLGAQGSVASRTEGISRSVSLISDQRTSMQRRLDDVEKRYRAQFGALDVLISNLSQTSEFLTQQLASLNK